MAETTSPRERMEALPTPADLERLEQAIPEFEAAAHEREQLAAELTAEAHGYLQIVDGFRAVRNRLVHTTTPAQTANGSHAHGTQVERLRGIAAVRAVMRPGGVWTARRVHDELERRGWVSEDAAHPRKATEAAIHRLWQRNKEIERVGRGEYRYKGAPTDRPALDTAGRAEP